MFKHEKSLIVSQYPSKILMKLHPKPFEILLQQVVRLKKNTNELKDSIFQFLRLNTGLQSIKDMQKEKRKPVSYNSKIIIKETNR
jgi:hypothetical protein